MKNDVISNVKITALCKCKLLSSLLCQSIYSFTECRIHFLLAMLMTLSGLSDHSLLFTVNESLERINLPGLYTMSEESNVVFSSCIQWDSISLGMCIVRLPLKEYYS